jgi:hypothetical protein
MFDLHFVRPGSPEWNYAWAQLARDPLNRGLPEPAVAYNEQFGEDWQYMGTVPTESGFTHQFRHRQHPTTKRREYRSYATTADAALDFAPAEELRNSESAKRSGDAV